jgi:hypothetical protein
MTPAMTRFSMVSALAGLSLLAACDKNAVQVIAAPVDGGAFVRFHNLSVASPSVNFYANTQKVTAVSSTACSPPPTTPNPLCSTTGVEQTTGTIGTAYGSSALGGNYAKLNPGAYVLVGRSAVPTDNAAAVSTVNQTLEAGKFYSYFMSGVYASGTKSTDAFIIEDKLPTTFDYTKSYLRVVNASVNAPSISASTTLQGTTTPITVATNVAYKGASEIVTIPPGLTDITITFTGFAPVTVTGFGFSGGHVYTMALRGDVTSGVAANKPAITVFTNR